MLELLNNSLVFRFPEVHPAAVLTITLHRTLRIPDDGKSYPLPPNLGSFPMVHVDDYKDKVSPKWVGRGGVMIPMYQSEALWFSINPGYCAERGVKYPFAIKCATGKVSALTGKEWSKKLKADDYMVAPGQPWLDGYVVADGTVRQFVAAPLGLGVTAEGQITGKEEFGGLQLEVMPMLLEKFEAKFPRIPPRHFAGIRSRSIMGSSSGYSFGLGSSKVGYDPSHKSAGLYSSALRGKGMSSSIPMTKSVESTNESYSYQNNITSCSLDTSDSSASFEFDLCREVSEGAAAPVAVAMQLDMGLAAGGRMQQQVFKDPHGIECWDTKNKTRVYIHMANSIGWQHVTGVVPPHPPLSAAQYTSYGYPWFSFYEEGAQSHVGTEKLKNLKSLAEIQAEKKIPLLPENQSIKVAKKQTRRQVRDGAWK